MVQKKEWAEFRKSGLLLLINQFLHIFGWAIVFEINDKTKEVDAVYPARVKFRGFDTESQKEAYSSISMYLLENAAQLAKEATEEAYVLPYGEEWVKEMNKFTKLELEVTFGIAGSGMTKEKQIEKIKLKLMKDEFIPIDGGTSMEDVMNGE